uniref:Box C/D snoRNA protein 1 n=1 Tax=Periophthalmus magnuspinnatus TaxID=409849 RepID=A0A3B4A809_9GOBI
INWLIVDHLERKHKQNGLDNKHLSIYKSFSSYNFTFQIRKHLLNNNASEFYHINVFLCGSCALCGCEEAKYTCPRCLTHSCSLFCVKKHKEDTGCSGVRDKTTFVALSQFDEMNLLSDYRFLEDTGRFSDGATRDALIKVPRVSMKAKRFMSIARKMNINLRLLPCTFTKSKENSTFFNSKVSDQLTLLEILNSYIHPSESDPWISCSWRYNIMFTHVLLLYRYHELDLHKSLRDNLSYKTLIEYPVLHVVLRTVVLLLRVLTQVKDQRKRERCQWMCQRMW